MCIGHSVEVEELLQSRATLLHSSWPGHGDGEGEQQHDEEEGHEPECPGDDVHLGLEVHGAALQVNGMIIVDNSKLAQIIYIQDILHCATDWST